MSSSSDETDPDSETESLAEKIRSLRDRVQRKQREREADRRAAARRVERGEPETVSEKVEVAKRDAAEAAAETKGLSADAVQLVSAEFGVSSEDAAGIIEQGSELLSAAGDQLDELDVDGDGDTDILDALDEGIEATPSGQRTERGEGEAEPDRAVDEFEPPVGDIEDDFEDVVGEGVEADIGLDFPIEEDR